MPATLKSKAVVRSPVKAKRPSSKKLAAGHELLSRVSVLEKQISLDEEELAEKRVDINKLSSVLSELKEMIALQNLQIKNHDDSDKDIRQNVARNREDFQLNTQKTREELINTIKDSLGDAPTRIVALEEHGQSIDEKVDRHGASIDRLADIAASLKEMVLLQNQRLQSQEQQSDRAAAALREYRVENSSEFISLNNAIQTGLKELLAALTLDTDRKVEALSRMIREQQDFNESERVKINAAAAAAEIKATAIETKQVLEKKEFRDVLKKENDKFRSRIEKLEKWWWIVMGGGVVFLIVSKMVDAGVLVHLLTL